MPTAKTPIHEHLPWSVRLFAAAPFPPPVSAVLVTAGFALAAGLYSRAFGLPFLAPFVEIDLLRTSPDAFRNFRREAKKLPELLECHLVSGNFDYLLKARVKDMQEYRRLLGEKILALPGVSDSRSYVVMEEVKETTSIPLT